MKTKQIIIFLLFAGIAGTGYYYREPIGNFLHLAADGLREIKKEKLEEIFSPAEKRVKTPPPLRKEKNITYSYLTSKGTIYETNRQRLANGKKELKEDTKLNEAAKNKAMDILAKQYFDHIAPDGRGPSDFVENTGYDYVTIGENLALGNFTDDKDLVQGWMESPGHRENILDPKFTEIGVAVVEGIYEYKKVWVAVQEFGTPITVCPVVEKNLKTDVDKNIKVINEMEEKLKKDRQQIDRIKSTDPDRKEKIEKYNTMVSDYNDIIRKTKEKIEEYNRQIAEYNNCLKNYQ